MTIRPTWATQDPLLTAYHDREWGQPLHDDRALFELLSLEGFQAGLNWLLVLKKRPALRAAFHQFDIDRVAAMTSDELAKLLEDPALIRNRLKLQAVVANAQAIQRIQQTQGSFDRYLWAFVANQPRINRPASEAEIPTRSVLSEQVAKDMKQQGFKFVGPVIIYSFLQGAGLIDDRLAGWHRQKDGR